MIEYRQKRKTRINENNSSNLKRHRVFEKNIVAKKLVGRTAEIKRTITLFCQIRAGLLIASFSSLKSDLTMLCQKREIGDSVYFAVSLPL